MSAAEPFKTAVTSVSDPHQGWRGGLERSRARPGSRQTRVLAETQIRQSRAHRAERRSAPDLQGVEKVALGSTKT